MKKQLRYCEMERSVYVIFMRVIFCFIEFIHIKLRHAISNQIDLTTKILNEISSGLTETGLNVV